MTKTEKSHVVVRVTPDPMYDDNGNMMCPACRTIARYSHDSYAHGDQVYVCICGLEYRNTQPAAPGKQDYLAPFIEASDRIVASRRVA